MKRILIFDDTVTGHHLEYLNHLYLKAVETQEAEFIFSIPESFNKHKSKMNWPEVDNIHFRFLSEEELSLEKRKEYLSNSWYLSLLIRKLIIETEADNVFFISLMGIMPFLPFFIPRNTHVSGIVYKIYLYVWKERSFGRKLIDLFLYYLFVFMPCFNKIFILNDKTAATYLNRIWQTDKFVFLVDPFFDQSTKFKPINPLHSKIIFFHFGSLTRRKGTITILQALLKMSDKECEQVHVIIAGRVHDEIREDFYCFTQLLSNKIKLEIHDEFVSYTKLEEFCAIADYLLIPYKDTAQSSGVLAFSAKYSVPVIGPKKGLLGKLIKKYNLGIILNKIDDDNLCAAIRDCINNPPYKIHTNYLDENTIELFQNQIFKSINMI